MSTDTGTGSLRQGLVEDLKRWLETYYKEEVAELVQRYPTEQTSLVIDAVDLMHVGDAGDQINQTLREAPDLMLRHLEEALQRLPAAEHADDGLAGATVRVTNISDEATYRVAEPTEAVRNEFVAIEGQVQQRTDAKPEAREAAFECQRCGAITRVPQDRGEFREPHQCQGCERQGPFRVDIEQTEFRQYQLIRLQRAPEHQIDGSSHLDVHLSDDLTDQLEGNERVRITGQLQLVPSDRDDPTFDVELDATEGGSIERRDDDIGAVELTPDAVDDIKQLAEQEDDVIRTLADSLTHMHLNEKLEDVTEALVLQMCSPPRKEPDTGKTFRGAIHIALVGDPGTGKSDLLQSVNRIAPVSEYGSGDGMTQAGLTAGSFSDDFGSTEYTLRTGLLARANKGIACLDEMDKLSEQAQGSLHETLANQQISVSKGGINATLPAQTRLLAAANPKRGRFQQYEPVVEQIDLEPTLFSRFDLVFVLQDQPDPEHDRQIADQITEQWEQATRATADARSMSDSVDELDVDAELFRAYVKFARERLDPVYESDEVRQELMESWLRLRSSADDDDDGVPVTARIMEGLSRLAEASARARLSDVISQEDVDRATRLMETTLMDIGVDPETGEFDADVVETGMSTTQRERVSTVTSVVEELQADNDPGAPIASVLKQAADRFDTDQERIAHTVDKLLQQGKLYSPDGQREYLRTM